MSDVVERLREGRTDGSHLRWTVTPIHIEAADEILLLRRELAEARNNALEEAACVASMWASRTATEANGLRKLRDYARAKQLISEAEGATSIAAAIRKLKETGE